MFAPEAEPQVAGEPTHPSKTSASMTAADDRHARGTRIEHGGDFDRRQRLDRPLSLGERRPHRMSTLARTRQILVDSRVQRA